MTCFRPCAQQRRQTHLTEALAANRHAFELARQLSERCERFYPRSEHAACAADLQSAQIVSEEETAIAAVNIYRALGGGGNTHLPVGGATGEG